MAKRVNEMNEKMNEKKGGRKGGRGEGGKEGRRNLYVNLRHQTESVHWLVVSYFFVICCRNGFERI